MSYRIAIIDTETTGLDPVSHEIIEIAMAVGDFTQDNGLVLIEALSMVVPCDENPVESVNGISPHLSKKGRIELSQILQTLEYCDAFVAHNAKFDKQFAHKLFSKIQDPDDREFLLGKPWVCTLEDYVWSGQGKRLTHLAADLGIFTTAGKHRALVDVMLLWEVVASQGYAAFKEAISRSLLPRWEARAMVSFDDREIAKAAGFQWNAERKMWLKEVRAETKGDIKFDFPIQLKGI
jgi:DNA polymerase III subunit epsilon